MVKTNYQVVKVKLRKKKKSAKKERKGNQNKNVSSINILIGTQRRYTGDKAAPNTKATGTIRNPNPYGAPAGQKPIMYIPIDQGTGGSVIPSNKRYIPGDYNKPPSDIEKETFPKNIKTEKTNNYIKTEPREQTTFNDRDGAGTGSNNVSDPSFVGTEDIDMSEYEKAAESKEMETTESSENDVQGDDYKNIDDRNVAKRVKIPTYSIEETPDSILAKSNRENTPEINQNVSSVGKMTPDSLSKRYSIGEGKNLLSKTPSKTPSPYVSPQEGVTPGVYSGLMYSKSPFSQLAEGVEKFKKRLSYVQEDEEPEELGEEY